jgi:hypothetical protein
MWRERVRVFVETNPIRVLNVAGPRASSGKNMEKFVHEVLDQMLHNAERD